MTLAAATAALALGHRSASSGLAQPPLSYLHTQGPAADPATALTWATLVLSGLVIIIMAALIAAGLWRGRSTLAAEAIADVAVERRGDGVRWIWIGAAITTVLLFATTVWTVMVLQRTAHAPEPPGLEITLTGHQWWWQAHYQGANPNDVFETANEIHIPVGRPVRLALKSNDVIHTFWVPALAGKTDLIPGRTNLTWLQASRPGVYYGQCTEYCGLQHANMAFIVVADPPEVFESWRARQAAAAPLPTTSDAARGLAIAARRCANCHTVRGTSLAGRTAPDLTHLMSRATLAAGMLSNTPGALAGWVANPQTLKPGAKMPQLFLSGPELTDVEAYLLTLK